ncbi:hypothetical protein [Saccharothrix deserti]|uniref:hypothetical protein n=1 Tax=Saccharothrix deserti TaxID=2593674 RepID=UPI00131C81BF|nr:hypothetical protein [Saccharothrix deserti]
MEHSAGKTRTAVDQGSVSSDALTTKSTDGTSATATVRRGASGLWTWPFSRVMKVFTLRWPMLHRPRPSGPRTPGSTP